METMQNKPGLVRRNGTYYARLRVPKNLREQIGKAEIKLSLKTKDRAEANAKLSEALVSIHRLFAAALNADKAVTPEAVEVGRGVLEQIARDWFRPRWEACEDTVWQPIPPGRSVEELIDIIDEDIAHVMSPDESIYGQYLYQARKLLGKLGYPNASGASTETLARYMIRGEVECLNMARRHHVELDLHHTIRDPLFRPVVASSEVGSAAAPVAQKNAVTVAQAIERFRNDPQRAGLSKKAIVAYETGFNLLLEIVGGNFPLVEVGRDHARKIRDVLANLPANVTKRFKGMTLLQAAQHAEANGVEPIAERTASNSLQAFATFFRWAKQEQIIADDAFAKGLKPTQKKLSKQESRQPFADADLDRLFSAEMYRGSYSDIPEKEQARYWIPLLGLYHGARLNELCQLEVADIREADGIPFMRFTQDSDAGEEKRLKTRNAERDVPIHPVLLQLGFLDYVDDQKRAGHVRLFPHITMSANGYYSENFGKWFGRFCDKQGVTDARLDFHSFRHGFNDATRSAKADGDVVKGICGWAAGSSMRDRYGNGYSVSRKLEELVKVRFPVVEKLLPLQGVNDVHNKD
ncbi:site-specific integrase [Ralstonia chuxiongensis]|uniref:Site-specific integrase n=1 Tax=Ralstonia chuxiongensis TaxID=2957504 RepID=A0AA41WR28_9RALS|nr:site-specific integrase [Ralstonia chuxiongensis]MCP1173658.1 site-specific integrase [Ralstonia chuxiongensis]